MQGVQPGEKVVVVGVEDLQDGQTVAPQPFTGTATSAPNPSLRSS